MSGPKVVRIVTREEILAICEGHLRRLDEAFLHWRTNANRIGELDESMLATTLARHAILRQLLRDDELLKLQKDVPAEISFLEHDLMRREERAVEKALQTRRAQRNLRENAASLLRALADTSTPGDPALFKALQSVAAGRALPDAAAVVAQAFAGLAITSGSDALSEAQLNLARALQVDRPEKWVNAKRPEREPRLERIDEGIARLQTLHGAGAAETFLHRLELVEREGYSGRQSMLLDSLVLDLAAVAADLRARSIALTSLRTLASELTGLAGDKEPHLLTEISVCLTDAQSDIAEIHALEEQCKMTIASFLQERVSTARRNAILEGLASLGYEVREGMETAWAEEGRVVLRKTSTPGYGVEIGGRAQEGRLQVRAVSLSGAHERSRDRDIETIWCGEFTRLQALLAQGGNELVIEQALAVGQVPLKVIDIAPEIGDSTSSVGSQSKH